MTPQLLSEGWFSFLLHLLLWQRSTIALRRLPEEKGIIWSYSSGGDSSLAQGLQGLFAADEVGETRLSALTLKAKEFLSWKVRMRHNGS